MNRINPFVLVSAYKDGVDDQELNRRRTQNMAVQLRALGLGVLEVTAVSPRGELDSLLVDLPGGDTAPEYKQVLGIAGWYGQDCLVLVSSDSSATLVLLSDTVGGEPSAEIGSGRWHEVDQFVAILAGAYVEYQGRFYVTD